MARKSDKPKIVYAIRNTVTQRIYIGCTNNLEARIPAHFKELKDGRKKRYGEKASLWQEDYDTHGRDSFLVYILEKDIPIERAAEREQFWIDKYQARDKARGYNYREPVPKRYPFKVEPGMPPIPEV